MAFTVSNIVPTTLDDNPAGATTLTVGAQSYVADRLYLLGVYARGSGAGTPQVTAVSGTGLTWTQVQFRTGSGEQIAVWRAQPLANTATALTLTLDLAPASVAYLLDEVQNADVLSPIVQPASANGTTDTGAAGGTGTTLAINLASAYTAGDALYAVFGIKFEQTVTPRSGWTVSGDYISGSTSDPATISSQYRLSSDTQASASWATGQRRSGIVIEIRKPSNANARPSVVNLPWAALAPTLFNDTITINVPLATTWADPVATWADASVEWVSGGMAVTFEFPVPALDVELNTAIAAPVATVFFAAVVPSFSAGVSVASPVMTFTAAALAPSTSAGSAIDAPVMTVALALNAPSVSGSTPVAVPLDFAIWTSDARPDRWDSVTRPDRWDSTTRPTRWFMTVFVREDRSVALTFVAYGPFTENEIPEALLIKVLRPLRAGGTQPLEIFNQTPAYTATVSIQPPSGPVQNRTAEIVDPDDLPVDYPDDFTDPEEGWVRVIWQDGDFPDDGTYSVQVTLDNGDVRLKSTDVWRPEVNVGPASEVGA